MTSVALAGGKPNRFFTGFVGHGAVSALARGVTKAADAAVRSTSTVFRVIGVSLGSMVGKSVGPDQVNQYYNAL